MDNQNEDNQMEPEPAAEAPKIPAPIPAVPAGHPVGGIPDSPDSPEYHAPESPDIGIIPNNRGSAAQGQDSTSRRGTRDPSVEIVGTHSREPDVQIVKMVEHRRGTPQGNHMSTALENRVRASWEREEAT